MKKRLLAGALIAVGVFAGFAVWQGMNPISTHHATIKIRVAPQGRHGDAYTSERQTQVDQVLPILTSIIQKAGMSDVTDSNVALSTTVFGNDEGDRILKFKGPATGRANTIPLEALLLVDTQEYETLSVHLSEGYSREPSARLSALHAELDQLLEPIAGISFDSNLW